MPYQKNSGMMSGKGDARGPRGGFRTDAAISNGRFAERTLQPWIPEAADGTDGGLESSTTAGAWDQFAENERRFGIRTDYDENIYTTEIDKSHPQYKERVAAAERKAREIERSQPTTAHVAEERVMDYIGGGDTVNEEDKYSGVRRQDMPAVAGRENKYTPPAKRAPSAQATVTGAPIDPAIISSQVRATGKTGKKTPTIFEETKAASQATLSSISGSVATTTTDPKLTKPLSTESSVKETLENSSAGTGAQGVNSGKSEAADKPATSQKPAQASTPIITPQAKDSTPSATSTVERDVLKSFRTFASQERQTADKIRTTKAKADKEVKLTELKKFATSFKLSTPVPSDLISIIAKDPAKQKEIQAKAIQNAEDIAHAKSSDSKEKERGLKDATTKSVTGTPTPQSNADTRPMTRPPASTHYASSPGSGGPHRHAAARQSYAPPSHHSQTMRNDRAGQSHLAQQGRQSLGQRLRNVEQQKMSQPPHPHALAPEVRLPPTGPASNNDASFTRRLSGAPNHMGAKLNPNSHEFKPNPFATSFNPNGAHPSAGSSPRSAVTNNAQDLSISSPPGLLIRRKTKSINVKQCYILAHVKTIETPQGRNWNDNDGLRPSYDTPPTWRQIDADEKSESTMRFTYREYLEEQSFAAPVATPNPSHANTNIAHHYQLPLHLQQGAPGSIPRQSPSLTSMPMHNQVGHGSHSQFSGMEDHRMMHSNSAQSYASPRLSQQVPMAYGPTVSSPGQVPFNQPMMQPYLTGPGTPQMGAQFRSFSNSHQYMPQQQGHMGQTMMMQPHFAPQGMVPAQMPLYGAHASFVAPNGGPPQAIQGPNGYPSPGRPSAAMMAHQNSQQGQVYGMSPNVQYQQPVFPNQQAGGQGAR